MAAEPPRVFYRVVRTDPPTLWDCTSNEERGRRPRRQLDAAGRRLWRGLSIFDTAEGARQAARTTPGLGSFIARLEIPPGALLEIERTGRAGHHTLWGRPADVHRLVVA